MKTAKLCSRVLLGLSLVSSLFACRHTGDKGGEALPDDRVRIDAGEAAPGAPGQARIIASDADSDLSSSPPVPLDLQGDSEGQELARLWSEGALVLSVRETKAAACEPAVLEAGTCIDDEEWQLVREGKRVKRSSCRCGVASEKNQSLSTKDWQELEQRILALKTTSLPPPCASSAPDVKIELTSAAGAKTVFAVNYGQCGGSGLAPRIELTSFEAFYQRLSQVNF